MKRFLTIIAIAIIGSISYTASASDWPASHIDNGVQYYLYNPYKACFLGENNTLTPYGMTLWTVNADGTIRSASGNYLTLTETHVDNSILGQVTSRRYTFVVNASTPDSWAVPFSDIRLIDGLEDSTYLLGNLIEDTWNRSLINGITTEEHVHYITVTDESTLCADSTEVNTPCGHWQFVKKDDYESTGAAKTEALNILKEAVERAEFVRDNIETTNGAKTALGTQILAAKTIISTGSSFLGGTIRLETIITTTDNLNKAIELCKSLSVPYLGALDEIANVEALGDATSIKTIANTAKDGVDAAIGVKTIQLALTTMHTSVLAYLRGLSEMPDGLDITAVLSNPSFEFGDMTGWYSTTGTINNSTSPRATETTEVTGWLGRYFLESNSGGLVSTGQYVYQAIIGLPVGKYRASAMMSLNTGLLNTNSATITAVVVPSSVLSGIGDPSMETILANIGTIIRDGDTKSGSVKTADSNTLEEASVEFEIVDGSIVLIGLNAGITPITGAVPYRADNVRLYTVNPPEVGIDAISSDHNPTLPAYNLMGLPVSPDYRGIVIQGARKYIRK